MALGIHCHDDLGLSTANTLAAVQAGADYPAVTVNGMGERAGNAPLHEVAVGMEKILKRDHGVDIKGLYDLSRMVEACSGVFIQPHTPIVGFNAFRHESGIHVDGILKHQQMYHGVDPEDVKRPSSIVLGTHTGTGTIRHLLAGRGYDADDTAVEEILRRVKKKKANEGKKDINRMVKQIDDFYSRRLSFPEKDFWEIVERVLDSGGQRDIR
jgi:isopropylmalate/homocitrate/citramalate synthase